MRPHKRLPICADHLDHHRFPDVARSATESNTMLITAGPMLCRLRIWTDKEWESLPVARRPEHHTHAPGLGWIGAVPIDCMN
jgi:hypothetical protein